MVAMNAPAPSAAAAVDPVPGASALRKLRAVSAPEAVSFLVLLVCSVLKRTTDVNLVMPFGMLHGILFILYVLFWTDARKKAGWPARTAVWFLVMSVLPTGGFFADRALRRAERGV